MYSEVRVYKFGCEELVSIYYVIMQCMRGHNISSRDS